jgi:hypothetical protein
MLRHPNSWLGLAAMTLAGGAFTLLRRRAFDAKLDAIEARLRGPSESSDARFAPPPEVVALARRLGARPETPAGFVEIEQLGTMWQAPGGKALTFSARQIIASHEPGFIWRAVMDPLRAVLVADWLESGHGGLEAKVLGAVPLATAAAGPGLDQGEMLRYLAELPWNPDAMLANAALSWSVVDALTIKVAAGEGAARGEITFSLDENGLIAGMSAPSRLYAQGSKAELRPWHGRFCDYQRADGYLVPFQGEVAWGLAEGDFVYWRGKLTSWKPGAHR